MSGIQSVVVVSRGGAELSVSRIQCVVVASRGVQVLYLALYSMVRTIANEIVSVLGPWNDGLTEWHMPRRNEIFFGIPIHETTRHCTRYDLGWYEVFPVKSLSHDSHLYGVIQAYTGNVDAAWSSGSSLGS